MTFNLTWNDGTVTEFASLPVKVQEIFGNVGQRAMERTARDKTNSDIRKLLVKGTDRLSSKVSQDEVKTWKEEHQSEYESMANEYMASFKSDALAGSIEMPGVSEESMTQEDRDRRSAAKKTILEVYAAHNQKYEWPHAGKGSTDDDKLAAEQAREAIYTDFFARLALGGDFVKIFNRHLNAIKKSRVAKSAATSTAKGGLDLLGGNPLAVAAQ